MSRFLVVGGTSAIGEASAHVLAEKGHDVDLAGRDLEGLDAIASDVAIRHDVDTSVLGFQARDMDGHREALTSYLSTTGDDLAGALWFVGYLAEGDQARGSAEEIDRVIDVNLTAAISCLELVGDHLADRGQGTIGVVSSVAGDRGRSSNYLYGSAKAGLSTYVAGLRNRLHHEGVTVTTVKPGFVDTAMTYGRDDMFLVADPERVARDTVEATLGGRNVVYSPWYWRPVLTVLRAVPEPIFKRLEL